MENDEKPEKKPEAAPLPRRRRWPFRLDLIPIFRSRGVAEARSDWRVFDWDRKLGSDLRWRARTLFSFGVLAGMAVFGVAVWFFLREAKRGGHEKIDGRVERQLQSSPAADAGVDAILVGEVEQVKQVVASFLKATTPRAKRKYVAGSEGIEGRMAEHYALSPASEQLVYDFPVIALRMVEGGNYYLVQALTVDGGRQNFVVLPDGGGGGPKIAWEAHVGYSEVDWDQYLAERPAEPKEMRVYLELSDHYAAPFENRDEFLAVTITRPGSSKELQGYVSKLGTRGLRGLAKLLLGGGRQPAVVRLAFLPGQAGSPVLVEELIQEGWFLPLPRQPGS